MTLDVHMVKRVSGWGQASERENWARKAIGKVNERENEDVAGDD